MTFGNDSLVWSISADYSVFTRDFFSSFINELSRLETAHTLLFVASEIFSWSTQTVNNAAVQICITIFAHEQKSSENFVRWFTLLCIFREKTINSQRIGKLFQVSFFSIGTIVFFFSCSNSKTRVFTLGIQKKQFWTLLFTSFCMPLCNLFPTLH